jgi:tetracycline resistance efflux pump
MEVIGTFWALVPPIIAIVLALVTKETYTSLFVGIIAAGILLAVATGDPINTLNYIISGQVFDPEVVADGTVSSPVVPDSVPDELSESVIDVGIINALSDSAGIFVFLVILGVTVALINKSGVSVAFGEWAAKHVKTRAGSIVATFFLGVLIFIDDYFNCLTVGAVMRPVTDAERVSRAKLSYVIDATAAPICMIAPISSWAAAVSDTADGLSTGISGIQLFINAIPFNFYSLLTIVFVLGITLMGFDYGPMAKSELLAYKEGYLGSLSKEERVTNDRARVIDMIIPVLVLIITCVIGMLYVGGFWGADGDYYMDLSGAFGNTDAGTALPWGSIIALVFTFLYYLIRRVLKFEDAATCLVEGFKAMVPALLILILALTLKSLTTGLGAAVFVQNALSGSAEALYMMLPAIIFLVALGLAFATGTSWGTFGILIPIVVAVFPETSTLLTIGISACLAGAVCGDHISPISDTTVMASAGATVNHIEHVNTQMPYALTVAAISFVMFILAGIIQNWVICLPIGIVLTIAVLFVLRSTVGKDTLEQYRKLRAAKTS